MYTRIQWKQRIRGKHQHFKEVGMCTVRYSFTSIKNNVFNEVWVCLYFYFILLLIMITMTTTIDHFAWFLKL